MSSKILFITFASLFIAIFTQAQNLPAYLPTDGLVGWWPFNGNANDESGNGQHLNQNGIVEFTNDRHGNSNASGYFTGNGYLNRNNAQLPIGNQDRTASFWVNQDSILVEHCVFSQYKIDACFNYFGFRLNGPPAAALLFDGGCSACAWGTYNSMDTWVNYTLVYENSYLTLYKNGVPLNTADDPYFSLDNPLTTQENFAIAYWGKPSDPDYFIGAIDDFGFWNRALSPAEVNALYTGEPVTPPSTCNPLPANLQNGLVGYWPFCGNANDESGNGNDGTVNGSTLTEDRFGVANSAYSFDGVDDFISVPNSNSIDITGTQITIAYWCKFSNNSLDSNYKGVSKGGWDTDGGYELIFRNGDDSGAIYLNGTLGGCRTMNINNYINQWFNVAATFDGVTAKIYIDGNLMPTTSGGIGLTSFFSSAQYPLFFGTRETANSLSGYLLGQLDDIGIWNRALAADEVQQLYTLNACTFTIYDTVTVTQTVYDTVSVSVSTTDTLIINTLITAVQPAQENTFLVYPNPAGSQITINNGNVGILGGYTLRITNSAGQELYNQNITQTEVTLDLSTWGGNGLYVLYVVDPQGEIIAVKQIVLQ